MPEKRRFPRKKRRLTVEFEWDRASCTGFTYDISAIGMFVRSTRLPRPGSRLRVTILLPDERHLSIRGVVVRSFRVPSSLARVIPSGFCLRLIDRPEEYLAFPASL
jgi:PilZ domain-containing protein